MSLKSFKYLILSICLSCSIQHSIAQDCTGFEPSVQINGPISGAFGSQTCVDFLTNGWDFPSGQGIQGYDLVISWDPTILSYASLVDKNMLNGPIGFGQTNTANGILITNYFDVNGACSPYPDNTCIFQVCFDVIGQFGECSSINIIEPIQITSENAFAGCDGCFFFPEVGPIDKFIVECDNLAGSIYSCGDDGSSSGSITFKPCGGAEPYTVELCDAGGSTIATEIVSNQGEDAVFDNLANGNYTIKTTDGNNTNYSDNVQVESASPINIQFDKMQPTCPPPFSNGQIDVTVTGGYALSASDYSYAWSNLQFSEDLEDVSSGIYTVTVSDLNGCTAEASCELYAPPIEVNNLVVTPATCFDSQDGNIFFTIDGGNDPSLLFDVDITEIFFFQDGIDTVNVDVDTGLYIIEIEDFVGCPLEIEVYVPYLFDRIQTQVYTQSELLCHGDNDACVYIELNQPGPYAFSTFTNQDGDPFPTNQENTDTGIIEVCNLPAGTYDWSASLVGVDCFFDTTIVISQPDTLIADGGNVDPNTSCTDPNGLVIIDATGGTGDYTYDWDPDVTDTDIFDMADAGTYTITVTDENFCTDTVSVIVIGATAFDIDIQRDSAIGCNGSALGGLTLLIDNTIDDLSIKWTMEEDASFCELTESITGLTAGTYYVEVIDNNSGCTALDTAILTEVQDVFLDIVTTTNPSCPDSADGIIEIQAMGGAAPYTATWADFPGNTSLRIDTATCGIFNVTITDDMGCFADTFVELTCPPLLVLDTMNLMGVLCHEDQTGMLTAMASGGTPTPNGEYNYYWSLNTCDIQFVVESKCNGLPIGEGWVVAEDANGCFSDTLFFNVPGPDEITLDLDNSIFMDPPCMGDCDGYANIVVNGGTFPNDVLMVEWSSPSPFVGAERNDLCAGDYTVTVTDEVGCTKELSFTLDEPNLPFLVSIDSMFTNDISCAGSANPDGRIRISTQGGTGDPINFTYNWSPDVSDNMSANNLTANVYTITVTDEGGCSRVVMHEINVPEPISFDIQPIVPIQCAGETTCIQLENLSGGTGDNYTFQLFNAPPTLPIDSCVEIRANENLRISVFDGNGGSCSVDTIISVPEPDPITVDLGDDITVDLGDASTTLEADYTSALAIISFDWSPVEDANCLAADCSTVTVEPIQNSTYGVLLTDENGCTGEDDINVFVREVRDVFMPNIFSPIGPQSDRKIMVFAGASAEMINFYKVYDRWGNEVYSVTDILPEDASNYGWDGAVNGRQSVMGVYVSIANIRFKDGKDYVFTQDVTLIR